MSNFTIYLIGTAFAVCGLALTAYKLGASTAWIVIGVIVAIGLGIMVAVSKTRLKEKSDKGN